LTSFLLYEIQWWWYYHLCVTKPLSYIPTFTKVILFLKRTVEHNLFSNSAILYWKIPYGFSNEHVPTQNPFESKICRTAIVPRHFLFTNNLFCLPKYFVTKGDSHDEWWRRHSKAINHCIIKDCSYALPGKHFIYGLTWTVTSLI